MLAEFLTPDCLPPGFLPVSLPAILVAFVVTAVAATVQGTIGFGFAVLSVPVLSLLDPALAPVPQLLVVFPLTLGMALRERHAIDLTGVWSILVGRFPGAAIGWMLVAVASRAALDLFIAAVVLSAVGAAGGGRSIPRTTTTKFLAGVASGTMSYVSSIGGPPLALLYRDAKGDSLRSTLAVIFVAGLLITISARLVAGQLSWRDAHVAAFLLPAVLLGLYLSRFLTGRVEGAPLRRGILIVAGTAAIGLVGKVVLG